MIMQLLADGASSAGETDTLKTVLAVLGWVTSFAVAIIGALTVRSAKAASKVEGKAEGKAEAMQIGPQPFIVQLREEFATRRELDKLETTILASAVKTEAAFEKFADLTAKQNDNLSKRLVSQSDRLSKKIEDVAGGAYQGRQRIHVTQNEHTAQIAALQANIDVARSLDKLADALKPQTKVQPTHPSNE